MDVILTYKLYSFKKTIICETGISNHKPICSPCPQVKLCRIQQKTVVCDLQKIIQEICQCFVVNYIKYLYQGTNTNQFINTEN